MTQPKPPPKPSDPWIWIGPQGGNVIAPDVNMALARNVMRNRFTVLPRGAHG